MVVAEFFEKYFKIGGDSYDQKILKWKHLQYYIMSSSIKHDRLSLNLLSLA